MEALLKASEASALMGLSVRHVQRMAKSGELPYQTHMNERNRPEYLFPLSSLPDAAQQKYFAEHAPAALPAAAPAKAKKADKPAACKPLEAYTAEERGEIGYWITTVDRWQTYRNKAGTKKAECDEKFVLLCRMEEPDRQISVETLYRKWAAIREGDYGALVDMRGKARKGMSKMPEAIERVFLTLYLDDRQYPIPRCIDMTKQWAQEEMPEALPLPCYHTFYRKAKALPEPVVVLCRQGPKAYYDQCSPYIRRNYENFFSNEVWVGDTHTLDVISISPEGIKHRLHLSAWQDARSGVFVGWYVSDNPGSQETLNALRKGIQNFGIPQTVYVDNGREFLNKDVGGLGHRAKKSRKEKDKKFSPPPGVFERLGIKMTNAIVRNARAKLVERRFEDFKNYISRLFPTYCGGNVTEKPENLKFVLKKGEHIPTDEEVIDAVNTLLPAYMNCQPYGGSVLADAKKTRIEVWQDHLPDGKVVRAASEEDLRLMMLRTSDPVRVSRSGVPLKIHGMKLWYHSAELCNFYFNKYVYVRYDPDDLSCVRVYGTDDKFLMEVPQSIMEANYNDNQEKIGRIMAYKRRAERDLQKFADALTLEDKDPERALNLVRNIAFRNASELELYPNSKLVELRYAREEPLLSVTQLDGTNKVYDVLAVVSIPSALQTPLQVDMGLDYIFPTNELLGNMVSADQPAMKTIFNVDEEHQLATENWLKNYTTNTDTALDYLSKVTLRQTFDGMINMYRLVGGALCAILALIGILNFINSMTTSILSRYREIAMLQSVGMTGRQVKQMLIYEGIGYSILGLFGSLILSVIASLTVVRMMGAELTYFTWHFTLLPVFLCIIPLILITAIVPLVCYNKMAQKTVVERLRIAE